MTVEEAKSAITLTLDRMNVVYSQTIFDEWMLVSLRPDGGAILAYSGPRAESYRREFATDVQPLRSVLAARKQNIGDFEFAHDAAGTRFDACLKTGPTSFLFCNNTKKSMTEIRQNPLWLDAQKPFAALSAKFQSDELR